jgi:hypothetical protein
MILRNVDRVLGARFFSAIAGTSPSFVGRTGSLVSDLRAVMRVLTTQMGLVINTVAEPAIAPAAIDSRVVKRDLCMVLTK